MKKRYKTRKYKLYNDKHSKKINKRNIQYRKYLTYKNKHGSHPSKFEKVVKRKKNDGYHEFLGPSNFSFIDNTEQLLDFFSESHKYFNERKRINFNLKNVNKLTPEAIAIFVAHLKDDRFTKGQKFSGVNPSDKKYGNMFRESGFYDYFNSTITTPSFSISKSINKITKNKVEPVIAGESGLNLPPIPE